MTGKCRVLNQIKSGQGVADIVVQTDSNIYIIELKMDAKAKDYLSQIKHKNYPALFRADKQFQGLPIVAVGLCFSSTSCTLIDKDFTDP